MYIAASTGSAVNWLKQGSFGTGVKKRMHTASDGQVVTSQPSMVQ